jgi:hypothetical protein
MTDFYQVVQIANKFIEIKKFQNLVNTVTNKNYAGEGDRWIITENDSFKSFRNFHFSPYPKIYTLK